MTTRRFSQLDVFTATPLRGNPLAVVHDATGLSDAEMQDFARWTNLSETTFLLPPTEAGADYRVRIFTPGGELPFAVTSLPGRLRHNGAAPVRQFSYQQLAFGCTLPLASRPPARSRTPPSIPRS